MFPDHSLLAMGRQMSMPIGQNNDGLQCNVAHLLPEEKSGEWSKVICFVFTLELCIGPGSCGECVRLRHFSVLRLIRLESSLYMSEAWNLHSVSVFAAWFFLARGFSPFFRFHILSRPFCSRG